MRQIPYGKQWIDEDDIQAVIAVIRSDWLTQGPAIGQFERALAEYCGAQHAVVFNSGTSALHGAYFVLGLGDGDEFITSPNTFVATANAGLYLGARPVFVDIEDDTGNIDVSKIEEKITNKTKLITPVHYAGSLADMEKINILARKHDLFIVEDACHALGSLYKGERTGACRYSDMTVFSFHPVKHITTGEGGAVLTNNKDFYEKLLFFRTHGISKKDFINEADGDWYYEMQYLGYNYRMTDIQAALGVSQLKKLEDFVQKRREIAKIYEESFKGNPYFDIPAEREYFFSSYHLYPVRLKDKYAGRKREIFSRLRQRGIGVQIHYIPVYLHPYYKKLGFDKGLCPVAEGFYRKVMSLPIYPAMEDGAALHVSEKVFEVLKEYE